MPRLLPGKAHAILHLSDGRAVNLNTEARHIEEQNGAQLLADGNGRLDYQTTDKTEGKKVYNRLEVPRGGEFQLALADGTKVWLNSLSTFRFPNRFSESMRNVELDGEGYFEVTHNGKAPFVIKTYKYDVKVLGTEFNLKAYKENQFFETALVKGCVVIEDADKKELVEMKPNERVVYANGSLQIHSMDDWDDFRWREGLFCFTNETISSLIQKLELYYDVKIRIESTDLTNCTYSGKFRIKDGIEHVLKVLQLNHRFDYTFDEGKNEITIK